MDKGEASSGGEVGGKTDLMENELARAPLLTGSQGPWAEGRGLWGEVGADLVLDLCFEELCPHFGGAVAGK